MNHKPYRIGIYVRVSTEEQAENPEGSIKNQEQRIREHVRMKNMDGNFGKIEEVFIDAGISGKDTNRPAFQRMLSKVRSKDINLIVVTELSRFTRSTKDFAILWEFLKENNCQFQSLRDNFDTASPAGEMIIFTLANFAQFERKQLGERVANSFLARAKRGLYNGGCLPLGYKIDPNKPGHLEIIPEEAAIVKEIFATFLREQTLARAARSLNDRNIRLPKFSHAGGLVRSGHFKIETVHHILRNKAYVGVRVFNSKSGQEETKAAWEPIIDPVQFARVQHLLSKNLGTRKPPQHNRYPYLLSGIFYCKTCGDRLSGKSAHGSGGKIPYYEHAWSTKNQSCLSKKALHCEPNRVLATRIEPLVWQEVKAILLSEEKAKVLFDEARNKIKQSGKASEVEKLKSKISGLQSQTEALAERISLLPPGLDPTALFNQMKKIQDTKQEWESRLIYLNNESQAVDEALSVDDFNGFVADLKKLLSKEKDPEVRAFIIRKLVYRVELSGDTLEIHYHAGKSHYWRELGDLPGSRIKSNAIGASDDLGGFSPKDKKNPTPLLRFQRRVLSSNSLTFGWGRRTRTSEC